MDQIEEPILRAQTPTTRSLSVAGDKVDEVFAGLHD